MNKENTRIITISTSVKVEGEFVPISIECKANSENFESVMTVLCDSFSNLTVNLRENEKRLNRQPPRGGHQGGRRVGECEGPNFFGRHGDTKRLVRQPPRGRNYGRRCEASSLFLGRYAKESLHVRQPPRGRNHVPDSVMKVGEYEYSKDHASTLRDWFSSVQRFPKPKKVKKAKLPQSPEQLKSLCEEKEEKERKRMQELDDQLENYFREDPRRDPGYDSD